jgi:DNA-binding GntR family transcriptional regulator
MSKATTTGKQSRQSVRQDTYESLKSMILTGKLRPSERLSENRLAERIGVSRTPLREALMKLEEEGLVVGRRNIGYTVVDLNIEAVCDLLVVREALDACAAELACKTATEQDFERIRELIAGMVEIRKGKLSRPIDVARDLELGIKIHKVIAEATRNLALIKMTEQVYQQLQLALWLEVLWVDMEDTGLDEHRAIAQAIFARDGNAAAKAARRHVQSSLQNMQKLHEVYRYRSGLSESEASVETMAARPKRGRPAPKVTKSPTKSLGR